MDNYECELREKWNDINYFSGGSLQLSIEHPLEWHVRYADKNQKSIVIVSEDPIEDVPSSKCIEVGCNVRKDGKYAISFTLLDSEQEDVFITMSGDIIQFSCVQKREEALKNVLKRYTAWMKLLDHKYRSILGLNEQKGLIGELLFLQNQLELGMPAEEAIQGWGGPEGADQDFYYKEGWYEIKTTGISSSSVSISSVEQLDKDESGKLIVFRIDKCTPNHKGAFTLYKMVHSILDLMHDNIKVSDDFMLKLGSAGYIDMLDYDKQNFIFESKEVYSVIEGFPRIRRKDIPSEIEQAKYNISIPSINFWKE